MTSQMFKVVFVTVPNLKTARKLARNALQERNAACANILPSVESHYWWKGKMERSSELLVVFKTTNSRLRSLREQVLADHPYDTPEFIALPISAGHASYLEWIRSSCMG